MEMGSEAFIEAHQLGFSYTAPATFWQRLINKPTTSVRVLKKISFGIPKGQHVVVFGRAGAGKSTLLKLLAGLETPTEGTLHVAGRTMSERNESTHRGYVSLQAAPAGSALSSSEQLRAQIARAVAAHAPVILLDDVADELGISATKILLAEQLLGHTVIIATRHGSTADALDLPLLLMHQGTIAHHGTREALARTVPLPRTVTLWLEGVQYDVIRRLKSHPGVLEVKLTPTTNFLGQRLDITLRSTRFLPSLYDSATQLPLVRIEETPARVTDAIDLIP